ncbi:hypothetical protein KSP39_PZI000263 [Platanthera zijinensis]|uniref:Uncharacterized protein n=1 Tax=Platanthera zijinensis TaxID=2320716 RepID=A0AAP0GFU8_9ASPA
MPATKKRRTRGEARPSPGMELRNSSRRGDVSAAKAAQCRREGVDPLGHGEGEGRNANRDRSSAEILLRASSTSWPVRKSVEVHDAPKTRRYARHYAKPPTCATPLKSSPLYLCAHRHKVHQAASGSALSEHKEVPASLSGFKKAIQTLCFSDPCFSDRYFSDDCNGAKQSLAARVIADTRFIYIPIIFLFVAARFPTPLPRFYKAASPVLKSRRCQNLLPFSALLALLQVRNFGYGFSSPSLQKVHQIRNFEQTISNRVLGPSVHWAGMLPRVLHAEDGKDLTHRIHSKSSLLKFVKYFGPLLILAAVFFIFGARYFDAQVLKLQPTRSNFFPCIKLETNDLNRLIKPPSILSHNMSDAELFWAASFVPQVKKYPFKRVAKAAFMFLTRGPLPLSPLWEKFFKGNEALYSIYIHSLPSYEASYPKHSVFYKRQIPSQEEEDNGRAKSGFRVIAGMKEVVEGIWELTGRGGLHMRWKRERGEGRQSGSLLGDRGGLQGM